MKFNYEQVFMLSSTDESVFPQMLKREFSGQFLVKLAPFITEMTKILALEISPKQEELIKKYGQKNIEGVTTIQPGTPGYNEYSKEFATWLTTNTFEINSPALTLDDIKNEKLTFSEFIGLSGASIIQL